MYSNCYCSCSFESEIMKIGQSFHKMYSNNILNFQECTTILNACTKKSGNLLKAPRISLNEERTDNRNSKIRKTRNMIKKIKKVKNNGTRRNSVKIY